MHLSTLLLSASFALGAVINTRQTTCTPDRVRQRVEWRTLSAADRKSYTDAVLCLAEKPSGQGLRDAKLYDDFPWAHARLNDNIHAVAGFLPWHRWFLQLYEDAVRECGYEGSFPYWDWTLDVASVPSSPIWAEDAFGGNGSPDRVETGGSIRRQCVDDGPFKNIRPVFYGSGREPHCLCRSWNAGGNTVGDMMAFAYTPAVVNRIQNLTTFVEYHRDLEGRPHGAVHVGISGDMMPSTSPNDPIFFMHHANVDRLWWLWQQSRPSGEGKGESNDYEGWREQNKWDGTDPPAATLDDVLDFSGLSQNLKVRDVMDTNTSLMCYRY